jgi:Flp pilus assembly protein TadD
MLTTKNGKPENGKWTTESGFSGRGAFALFSRFHLRFFLCLAISAVLAGCKPPGPRALLDGKDLVERGKYTQAIDRLKKATSLLSTNAQAWNYLGIAYHQAGQANDAADAYKKALAFDQNLVEAHYNLGCLFLDQNRPDQAKAELTAYTLHRDKSPEGWIKLGEAQLRLHDLAGAEKSFNQARQFDPQNPEALNGMGVIQMQRNHPTEAAQFFNGAVTTKPDYAPAILNLAIVSQLYLNNRQFALQRYQDYLTLRPQPANWDAVNAAAAALAQELNPPRPVPQPTVAAPRPVAPANPAGSSRPTNNFVVRAAPPRPEPAASSNPRVTTSAPTAPVEVVQLGPEPVVRSAQDVGSTSSEPARPSTGTQNIAESPKEKRGFFSHMNPANLFRSNSRPEQPVAPAEQPTSTQVSTITPEPAPMAYSRYSYRSPRKPADGNRGAAEKEFAQGSQAQQARQFSEAAQSYRRASQLDPGYFDPYYNLGVVSVQSGNLPQALSAYETALAIQPNSHDARFNFALVLKQANYPLDAANELEKLLLKFPNDANAHYTVANLYAQQLRQPTKAREHYQKVLELTPNFSQAPAIHDWLWANPR